MTSLKTSQTSLMTSHYSNLVVLSIAFRKIIIFFKIHNIHTTGCPQKSTPPIFICILKAHSHSHSMSGRSIWASLKCNCSFWIAGGLVSYLTRWLLTFQLCKNNIDTQEKLRLNFNSLNLSVSEPLETREYLIKGLFHFTHGINDLLIILSPARRRMVKVWKWSNGTLIFKLSVWYANR